MTEDNNDRKNIEEIPQSVMAPEWTIHVSEVRTVRVGNVSNAVSEHDIKEFFSFSGDIQYIETQRESETTQLAYVTFKQPQGVDTAVLLSGATIGDLSVTITPVDDYQLPPQAHLPSSLDGKSILTGDTIKKAEDVVSSMLARGFVLGKDAIKRAKELDERHQWTSNASATVASIDQKTGLTEKVMVGTTVVNDKVREMDERYHVSERTKTAMAIAEQKASNMWSSVLSNQYMYAGASWVSTAIGSVAMAAKDVENMTREKVVEEEKKQQAAEVGRHEQVLDGGKAGAAPVPNGSADTKLEII
ncbi:hypothetical protein SAY87_018498 [Trapa incisa]|uniref:RRM domain-containing protein n=1 Tax=Trapa incisa TaxID=236973 RepID=A0AAN7LC02_9MYRT|nr:hypothetical protein SAY87_018498 [Trapa incisa]